MSEYILDSTKVKTNVLQKPMAKSAVFFRKHDPHADRGILVSPVVLTKDTLPLSCPRVEGSP